MTGTFRENSRALGAHVKGGSVSSITMEPATGVSWNPPRPPRGRFNTTQWSLILAARDKGSRRSQEALALLCQLYWYPLYAYIRRQGHAADQAQDLTQEFFTRLLEKDSLAGVDREKGRFRSFLLAACKHFLCNQYDWARCQKRGGRYERISLDLGSAEGRYAHEPHHALTPEKLFHRRWAMTLLERVLARLRQESARGGKLELFDKLKVFLTAEGTGPLYRDLAGSLGMSEGALRVSIHRLRRRYGELLRAEIGRTVDGPDAVDAEIRFLFAALGS